MKLDQFRKLVRAEFGVDLEHATPANVREFLDLMESDVLPGNLANRITLNEPCGSYEEVIRDFFAKILELPPEEAIVSLWTLSLYLAFSAIELQYADRFAPLFPDVD
ncbi:MAG: hypothetical protein M1133_13285 [Armatimonadetes bacterium]|nr:hypothetical protein [Armatimonadota bacterium]